ncbi:hypothetical protein BO78DRAFT_389980 [Aspergillus sclerotiicarbonarius CBS 121057]|uniref:Uncharacterized protein n=1 Tax=Aspergillus sclerotiicarbonarius (strain CBS 121057 / IBT 28362) TaxID=1448318 RepID=A0A319EPI8_ASPSB|nr:hypothetical protein BO78DRAFT_389980 [Aspergillus sclerotiicarbonarius CBS 121057]
MANLEGTSNTQDIAMNEVAFVPFRRELRIFRIQPLNGSTVVVMLSTHGAILANIPPLPYLTHDPNIGLQNLDRRMDEFLALYEEYMAESQGGSECKKKGSLDPMSTYTRSFQAYRRTEGFCLIQGLELLQFLSIIIHSTRSEHS